MPIFSGVRTAEMSPHGHTYLYKVGSAIKQKAYAKERLAACWPTNRHATRTCTI